MKKNRKYFIIAAILLIILGTSYYSMNKAQNTSNDKDSELQKEEIAKIPRIIKAFNLSFDKTTTSFTSEPVEVFKDKTEEKMVLFFDDKVDDNISAKIYQDDKLIEEIKKVETSRYYVIPYKMNSDKSIFKIQVDCLVPLDESEKLTTKVSWYPNRSS